nr:spike protein [Eptesicus bat coronavirus]
MKLIILFCFFYACNARTPNHTWTSGTCKDSVRDFSYLVLGLPPNTSRAIVTGFFPLNQTNAWFCGHGHNFWGIGKHGQAHGLFISHDTHNREFSFAFGKKGGSTGWQFHMFKLHQEFNLKVCRWPGSHMPTGIYPESPTECLYNYNPKVNAGLVDHVMVGVTWSNDIVTLHWHKYIHTMYVPGASEWNQASVFLQDDSDSLAFQFVNETRTFFVSTNGLGNITQYQVCNNCVGYAENIFANTANGHIPADFTPHNWFVLTNHSSVIHGTIVANQPVRVLCLRPIPVGVAAEGVLSFSEFNTTLCNGYALNGTADAIRFNLNYTDNPFEHASNESVVINTDLGRFTFICGNSSEPSDSGFFPFGKQDTPFYCFLNSSLLSKPAFLGVLPRILREFVFTKWGSVYINGYNYFQLPPITNITFNLYSKNNTGFWTVAYTQYTDVLLQVNGTDITKVLYCDSYIERLKCAQKSFNLDNGFYNAATIKGKQLPKTIVALPFNFDFVNVTINVRWAHLDINNASSFCVNASQFSIKINFTTNEGDDNAISQHSGNCPFTLQSLNDYISFNRICFSVVNFADACRMYFQYKTNYVHTYAFTLYVSYSYGDRIMGVPASGIGVADVSQVVFNSCTEYNIYGMVGTGVISPTNLAFIGGLYYTSVSGNLLGFKNISTDEVYSIRPCAYTEQLAVINDKLVGVLTADNGTILGFNSTIEMPTFYYHTSSQNNCTTPIITYSNFGVCEDGGVTFLEAVDGPADIIPIQHGNVSIPVNFTIAVHTEYIQHSNRPIAVDCRTYVCSGNPRCNKLLTQYAQACLNIEQALRMSARIESVDLNEQIAVNQQALSLATPQTFNSSGYDFGPVLPTEKGKRSKIEDILFNKVVTTGLGTVDQDYKSCSQGLSIADLACAQYYNGIMVLPGVVDPAKMAMYTGSLIGGMALGGITAAASAPFSIAVQARLNYVALQTDVLQNNQKQLATAFNNAIGNITQAFDRVGGAIEQTAQGLVTVANALNKVQDVVNTQGNALTHLTEQLQNNFQAISSSIQTIYTRLDELSADAQVDRLITGRLASLNAFVAQTLNRYTEVKASRALAFEKINECVKSQSSRFGFCGNGTHLFSIVNSAPEGFIFFHTVLVPSSHITVRAFAGFCYENRAFVLHDVKLLLFHGNSTHYQLTPRTMFQPRVPTPGDFVEIASCTVEHVNITTGNIQEIFPDHFDVNSTINDILSKIPNWTIPQFPLDIFNQTYLNLSGEIADLEQRSESLKNYTIDLRHLIDNLNKTLVDLEWLNRIETYVKWPWWVWLIIVISLIFTIALLAFCCLTTGCCGCCGCVGGCLSSCCSRTKLKPYTELEKLHIQ